MGYSPVKRDHNDELLIDDIPTLEGKTQAVFWLDAKLRKHCYEDLTKCQGSCHGKG